MNKAKCSLLLAIAIFGTVGIFVRFIPLSAATVALGAALILSSTLIGELLPEKMGRKFAKKG